MEKTTKKLKKTAQNKGQKVISKIRQAYMDGPLAVSDNPTAEIQTMLNQPVSIKSELYKTDTRDKKFLQDIIAKVDSGAIQLFTPSSLLNKPVYDHLSPALRAKADYDILNLLSKIRQIKKLWDTGHQDSYQIFNLIHSLRLTKENLESAEGDVFII